MGGGLPKENNNGGGSNALSRKSPGYSAEEFATDSLVPLDTFACLPHKDAVVQEGVSMRGRMMELASELVRYNDMRCDAFNEELRNGGPPQDYQRPATPKKAFCRVRLTKAEIDTCGGHIFDLSEDSALLEVRLSGLVLVPPTADFCNGPIGDDDFALAVMEHSRDEEQPLKMFVQVWCVIKSQPRIEGMKGNETAGIEIEVKHLVFRLRDGGSDPMVESWLPVNDLMLCLSLALNRKLKSFIYNQEESESGDEHMEN